MNRLFNRLFKRTLSNKGYTIDQTILIVAIIAILITLVIVTVGWQLINRTSGTKTASQVRQIEEANGQFFSQHRVWPHQAYTTANVTSANNILALENALPTGTAFISPVNTADVRNLLPGFNGANHNIGSGGTIRMQPQVVGGETRYVIEFTGVPYAEAAEAEKNIDNDVDSATNNVAGRIFILSATCLGTAGGALPTLTAASSATATASIRLCYVANAVQ